MKLKKDQQKIFKWLRLATCKGKDCRKGAKYFKYEKEIGFVATDGSIALIWHTEFNIPEGHYKVDKNELVLVDTLEPLPIMHKVVEGHRESVVEYVYCSELSVINFTNALSYWIVSKYLKRIENKALDLQKLYDLSRITEHSGFSQVVLGFTEDGIVIVEFWKDEEMRFSGLIAPFDYEKPYCEVAKTH